MNYKLFKHSVHGTATTKKVKDATAPPDELFISVCIVIQQKQTWQTISLSAKLNHSLTRLLTFTFVLKQYPT